jgi:hypothetical protein
MLYTALERIVNWQFIRPTTHADLTGVLVLFKNLLDDTHTGRHLDLVQQNIATG